jgi:hypothetical protein
LDIRKNKLMEFEVNYKYDGKKYTKQELVKMPLSKLRYLGEIIGLPEHITSYRPPTPPKGYTRRGTYDRIRYKKKYRRILILMILKLQ